MSAEAATAARTVPALPWARLILSKYCAVAPAYQVAAASAIVENPAEYQGRHVEPVGPSLGQLAIALHRSADPGFVPCDECSGDGEPCPACDGTAYKPDEDAGPASTWDAEADAELGLALSA